MIDLKTDEIKSIKRKMIFRVQIIISGWTLGQLMLTNSDYTSRQQEPNIMDKWVEAQKSPSKSNIGLNPIDTNIKPNSMEPIFNSSECLYEMF